MPPHKPVLFKEVIEALALEEGLTVVDATVGMGGHAIGIAEHLGARGTLIGLDRDASAIAAAERILAGVAPRVELRHASYADLDEVLRGLGIDSVDRVLADLGFGSHQMDDPGRGLSFRSSTSLDMRYDQTSGPTALDLLRTTPEKELGRWFREYGEERFWRRIAQAICEERKRQLLPMTGGELAELVVRAVPPSARSGRIHPATRVFQALRIATNRELEVLEAGLAAACRALRVGGRLVVISFHSLEDRLVKTFFRENLQRLTKKPVTAGPEELQSNPRSRSAKLRVAVKTADSDPPVGRQEAWR
ncbi:MAG: 16S rRNA (cytosine(1402)-N(4))-methyltransferase RsmH [Planctomycetes bacterium]|nr:16S rRNA (cytosine(1402)-N(4))-methyltransferase RsmH [Planctomycetota bacterium]MCB9919022.1 16S rRNA (cytosine(1402)-N(4))-methyltransferase RsmH [Planctomycetota bacterium]